MTLAIFGRGQELDKEICAILCVLSRLKRPRSPSSRPHSNLVPIPLDHQFRTLLSLGQAFKPLTSPSALPRARLFVQPDVA